ncbi:SusD/RagB family nutrient-binding outer membrane lipoprotein [Pedobacter sp. MC2016-05]|uniref:SusD/RagB family nutrient-binding outer membrane lipoprotein n=1 Tax=Pedobacter sp. MC2016-05 TaxID=2994474 RepID=UPI0022481DA6|nr:SusD/RagB family nutrient-binding outer membrane lipoprotein [Pedobacter sp. MC2016-05]MCX2472809.1 SusD/RagB family nutrient-binding outer membrane lipoprotein [Pedobacter sp. MC2016-05]
MKKIIYAFTLLFLVMTGCKKSFFDINQNPNSPTEGSITAQLLLPSALTRTAAKMATSYNYAAMWMGYWTRSGTYGPSVEQESYAITTTFGAGQWTATNTGWYDILFDASLMEKKGLASGETFYVGASKVIKSIGFMYLVDQFGNVPYSKAFDFQNNILPAYDKGEDIYADLLVKLDEAAKTFASANVTAEMRAADVLFKGDLTKWRKLVNTQRLKLLIHQSEYLSAAAVSAEIAKINADGSGFIASGGTASVNPGYAIIRDQQNPFWGAYKLTELGAVVDDYNRANNYILGKFRNNADIRYQYVFSRAATPLNGNIYYGYNYGETIPNSDPKAINSSDVAGPGLAKSATQDQWLFTSVESLFLQAEAIQRGWIPGTPETAYRAAVQESFVWLGVTNAVATATTYLDQNANPLVSWSLATDKVRLIDMQKYMALIGINNFEAYVDYRRLGVPSDLPLSLSPSRGGNVIPTRLLYPQSEYNTNAANVAAQGVINAQTSKIFWDK